MWKAWSKICILGLPWCVAVCGVNGGSQGPRDKSDRANPTGRGWTHYAMYGRAIGPEPTTTTDLHERGEGRGGGEEDLLVGDARADALLKAVQHVEPVRKGNAYTCVFVLMVHGDSGG